MRLGALALAMTGMAVTTYAALSLDSAYDLKKEVTLEGKIGNVLLRNPHSFLQIEVAGKDGTTERWVLEWNSATSLRKRGIKSGTLMAGDQVTFTIHPPRKPPHNRGMLAALHRESDGFDWSSKTRKTR
jgi:hypothetical protein